MKKSLFNNKLPSNWEWVILDELLIEKPCNGLYKSANFIGKGTLFLDINGLYKGLTADFSQARRVEITENECRQYELVKGDILFNRVSKMPEGVGKAVAVGELQEAAVYESNMIRVRLNKQRVDSLFVVNYLSTNRSRQELLSKANISNQASINQQAIKSLAIPLPPITEQRRILTILDRAQSLISKRREAIGQLDTLTQAIFIEMFGDPVTNPKGWDMGKTLGDVAELVSGITKGRKLNGKVVREIPYLAVVNVQDRRLDLTIIKTIEATEDEISRYKLQVNDLLLTEGGDPDKLGRGTLWNGELPECIHQNHIFRVRITLNLIHPLFLIWLIGSQRGKKYFLKQAKQTTGIATINMTQLRGFSLLIPPLSLQKEFADRIEAVEKLKAAHRASLSELHALFASLQHRAFRGEL